MGRAASNGRVPRVRAVACVSRLPASRRAQHVARLCCSLGEPRDDLAAKVIVGHREEDEHEESLERVDNDEKILQNDVTGDEQKQSEHPCHAEKEGESQSGFQDLHRASLFDGFDGALLGHHVELGEQDERVHQNDQADWSGERWEEDGSVLHPTAVKAQNKEWLDTSVWHLLSMFL